jgi:hypothetical protein
MRPLGSVRLARLGSVGLSRRIMTVSSGFPYFLSRDAREMEMLEGKSIWDTDCE